MRLLLRADVEGLGHKGDIVEVADGYGRNYLIPKGMALLATAGVEAQAEAMKRARDAADRQAREAAERVASELAGRPVTLTHRAGEGGKLFGSVTAAEIAETLHETAGLEVDRRRIHIEEPIRSLGSHTVMVRLHPEVEFPVTVEVVEA